MTILQAKQKIHECWMQLTKDGKDEELAKAVSIAEITLGNYDECLKADMVAMLDKIRADIMQLDYDTESIDYDYNDMPQTETVHTICREEVLQIIDKYKGESEKV